MLSLKAMVGSMSLQATAQLAQFGQMLARSKDQAEQAEQAVGVVLVAPEQVASVDGAAGVARQDLVV